MINLNQILEYYPKYLHAFKESILKEYLQCKILNSIFQSKYANKLVFLGGTALRIIYGSSRFSEDLDFDNFNLKEAEFIDIGKIVKSDLELEGLEIEINTITKNVFRIKIRIPKLLYNTGLYKLIDQKILIQIDTTPHEYIYNADKPFLNRFEVFTNINVVPKNILLSQKLYASMNRKRIMGRDFFDIVFLYGLGAMPDFPYLEKKMNIKNICELKEFILNKTKNIDFKEIAQDVEPLLFDPRDKQKVLYFREFIEKKENCN